MRVPDGRQIGREVGRAHVREVAVAVNMDAEGEALWDEQLDWAVRLACE